MKIVKNLLSCTKGNEADKDVRYEAKRPLAAKLASADNRPYSAPQSIERGQSSSLNKLRSSMKNASVEARLQALEPVLQRKMEQYVSTFDNNDKSKLILGYYSGRLNTHIDTHVHKIISADSEKAKENIKEYRKTLLNAVLELKIPQGLTEGGPSVIVDQVTDLYDKAGFLYSVRKKDEKNDSICNDVERVKDSISRVVDNIAQNISREFNMAQPEEFQERLKITTQEFEASIYNARNGSPDIKNKLFYSSGVPLAPLATISELELFERGYKETSV